MQGDFFNRFWCMDEPWRDRNLSGNGRGLAGKSSIDHGSVPQPEVDKVSGDRVKKNFHHLDLDAH